MDNKFVDWGNLGVAAATLILAIVGAIAGYVKFNSVDKKLALVNEALAEGQLKRSKEQLIQIDGTLSESPYAIPFATGEGSIKQSKVRRVSLSIELKNIGDAQLQIGKIEIAVFRKALDAKWANILPNAGGLASTTQVHVPAPAPPVQADRQSPIASEEVAPKETYFGLVDVYSTDAADWTELHNWDLLLSAAHWEWQGGNHDRGASPVL